MNLDKYLYAKKFLIDHPAMSLDQALEYVDKKLKEGEIE
jgi:hypothetical protein